MKFENPYENMPAEERVRTTIDVSSKTHAFVLGLRGRKGTLQTTINLLLEKLLTTLIEHGITSFDPHEYEHAVANARIVFPTRDGNAASGNQKPRTNVRRGTRGVAQHSAESPNVPNPSGPSARVANKRT